jgi:hypothetical protein
MADWKYTIGHEAGHQVQRALFGTLFPDYNAVDTSQLPPMCSTKLRRGSGRRCRFRGLRRPPTVSRKMTTT